MEAKVQRLISLMVALAAFLPLSAQKKSEQTDSLVRLMKGSSLQLIEKDGINYRKAIDATFLHNGTYLICDTALWNVDTKIINAEGHVKVIQDETILTSDRMDYYIDDNLVKFRGSLVQMENRQKNILRTRHLDYNTRDSIAVFKDGGAMRDQDGQVIESIEGTYDSRQRVFDFVTNVNMFTDSVFVKTSSLRYEAGPNMIHFNSYIDFWKDGNMLSANTGWYDRGRETFFFRGAVHGLTEDQEVWSDTLYFYRGVNDVLMLGDAHIQDTTRNVAAMADYMFYQDSLSRITLRDRAAVALRTEQEHKIDTIWFGADSLVYQTFMKFEIPASVIKASEERLSDMFVDPVLEYRQKAAKEAAKRAEEAAQQDVNLRNKSMASKSVKDKATPAEAAVPATANEAPVPQMDDTLAAATDTLKAPADTLVSPIDTLPAPADTLAAVADTLSDPADMLSEAVDTVESPAETPGAPADTLAAPADTLAGPVEEPKDSTKVGFLTCVRNVKIFRQDMQVLCDSMRYCELDSIARFYIDPIVWNDGNRQYTSDSLFVLPKEGGLDRASLQSNAFIITQEDSTYFDQIKGAEVMAYFDTTSALRRFDALGGATALFYLRENDELATVNKVESKMLSANLRGGEVERVYYFEDPKNNAYPIVQLPPSDHTMKGFDWRPDLRPTGRLDITEMTVRPSERSSYLRRPRTRFKYTDIYFPGYMDKVQKEIALRDSLKKSPRPTRHEAVLDTVANVVADTMAVVVRDTSAASMPQIDSMAVKAPADSTITAVAVDTLATAASPSQEIDPLAVPTVDKRQQRREQREEARKLRIARRDARWAELDARDAAKEAARLQKELARKRARTLAAIRRQQAQDARDAAKLQKYIERYEQRKRKPARERAPRVEARGELSPTPES